MIGFHFQESPRDWPRAVAKLPAGAPVKIVEAFERATEVKAHNPQAVTWIRHVEEQPYPHGDQEQLANAMFARFVNPDAPHWRHVDLVQGWNEFYANSQDEAERALWVSWDVTCAKVWNDWRQRHPQLAHIRYVMSEVAPGNFVPIDAARGAVKHGAVVGLHTYGYVDANGQPKSGDWHYVSGLFNTLDEQWRSHGIRVTWAFGEMGPIWSAVEGWRAIYGNIDGLIGWYKWWLDKVVNTVPYREGRVIGGVHFTSGAPGSGPDWSRFDLRQPEMDKLAQFVSDYMATAPKPGTPPPPEPPPVVQPPPSPTRYKVVVNLLPQDATVTEAQHVLAQTHGARETACYSADDAGRLVEGGRDDSFVRVWGVERWGGGDIQTWLRERYGAASHAAALPRPTAELAVIDVVDTLPRSTSRVYYVRPLDAITHIVIHHTVGDGTPESIARYHVNTRDWPGIGYHYVITADGTVYQTNRHETMSYHVGSENGYSLGVALVGDFRGTEPSTAQINAAQALVRALRESLPNAGAVVGHRDLPNQATACPGDTYTEWLPTLR